jgi:F0F1-type ATP synthase assembly protein I
LLTGRSERKLFAYLIQNPLENEKKSDNKNKLNAYVKYSGIAFQMMLIILLSLFGGIKLDEIAGIEFPIFTLTLTILGFTLALYYMIKAFLNNNK